MSRSRQHTPIFGHARSASEKDDKQRAAMRVRKFVHGRLKPHAIADDAFDMADFVEHPRSGQWSFAKDGKCWWKRATASEMRK